MTDIGFGTEFRRHDGVAFQDLGIEVIDFGPPTATRDTVETTHHKSPKRTKEFIGGLIDEGELTLTLQMSGPGALTPFYKDLRDNAPKQYQMLWPDATNWDFDGLVTSIDAEDPMADRMTATITIKLTGASAFVDAMEVAA